MVFRGPTARWQRRLRLVICLLAIPVIGLVVLIVQAQTRSTDFACQKRISLAAANAENNLFRFFTPITGQLDILQHAADQGAFEAPDEHVLDLWLSAVLSATKVSDGLWWVGASGAPRFWSRTEKRWVESEKLDPVEAAEVASLRTLKLAQADHIQWHELSRGGILSCKSYRKAPNGPGGLFALRIPENEWQQVVGSISLGVIDAKDARILIFGDQNVLQIAPGSKDLLQLSPLDQFIGKQDASLVAQLESGTSEAEAFPVTFDGQAMWCGLRPSGSEEGRVIIGVAASRDVLLAESRRFEFVAALILLGLIVLGGAGAVGLARHYREQLEQAADRPRNTQAGETELSALIAGGENERLEFKSTMRWNLKADKAGKEISHAWLKTLVAYLNTGGGTLLVGVEDNGNILGIEPDRFPNEDKYLLHFNNLLKEHIGLEVTGLIRFALRPLNGKKILVVDCEPSAAPVFLRDGEEEEFYIRVGPGSRKLPASKILEYIRTR